MKEKRKRKEREERYRMACQSVAHGCGRTILLSPIPKDPRDAPKGLWPFSSRKKRLAGRARC